MDPLSGLAVAGAVIQFVDFGTKFATKVVSKTGEIFKAMQAGYAEDAFASVERITERDAKAIFVLTAKLQRPLRPNGSPVPARADEKALIELCDGCDSIAAEILSHMDGLTSKIRQIKNDETKWYDKSGMDQRIKSFRLAFRAVWTEDKLKNMCQRFSMAKESLVLNVLVSMSENIHLLSTQIEGFALQDQSTRDIINSMLETQGVFKDVRDQMIAVAQLINRLDSLETLVVNENSKTRYAILNALHQIDYYAGWQQDSTAQGVEQTGPAHKMRDNYLYKANEMILESLQYRTMTDRLEDVEEAHGKTFEWIFRDATSDEIPWDSFVNWLKYGYGVYWMNGKAGSGKSTLMRYIHDKPHTRRLLSTWAEPLPLTTATFFFWNSGTSLQRSQSGLLRSLLYEILSQHRELIGNLLPALWARNYNAIIESSTPNGETWSLPRLKQLFLNLVTQDKIRWKTCLFIDGLDEYDGDHAEIAKLIHNVAASKNVKICLSSRPLIVFEDAFRSSSKLCLQDLTFQDIRKYAKARLEQNEIFLQLTMEEAPKLIDEIVTKADGVFLWVTLAVKSLLTGLRNRDGLSFLQTRLRFLPKKLSDMYEHMLSQIDAEYKCKASEYFQILRAVNQVDDITGSTEDDPEMLTIFGLALADEDDPDLALKQKIELWSDSKITQKCEHMEYRLKARCSGLLEVQNYHIPKRSQVLMPRRAVAESRRRVQYLHRTLREYLEEPEFWKSQLQATCSYQFNPHLQMLKSYVLQFKVLPVATPFLVQTMPIALIHAHFADTGVLDPYVDLLDQLENAVSHSWKNTQYEDGIIDYWADGNMLVKAIQYGCGTYVKQKLKLKRSFGSKKQQSKIDYNGRPLLDLHVSPDLPYCKMPLSVRTIRALLENGAKPNRIYNNATPWERAIKVLFERHLSIPPNDCEKERNLALEGAEVFKVFLQYGAKPDTTFDTAKGVVSASTVVDRTFVRLSSDEMTDVRRHLDGKSNAGFKRRSMFRSLWTSMKER